MLLGALLACGAKQTSRQARHAGPDPDEGAQLEEDRQLERDRQDELARQQARDEQRNAEEALAKRIREEGERERKAIAERKAFEATLRAKQDELRAKRAEREAERQRQLREAEEAQEEEQGRTAYATWIRLLPRLRAKCGMISTASSKGAGAIVVFAKGIPALQGSQRTLACASAEVDRILAAEQREADRKALTETIGGMQCAATCASPQCPVCCVRDGIVSCTDGAPR
jgi:hypothetical protein